MVWATPIEPLQHKPQGCVDELCQAGGVPRDSVVIVIPTELGLSGDKDPLSEVLSPPDGHGTRSSYEDWRTEVLGLAQVEV